MKNKLYLPVIFCFLFASTLFPTAIRAEKLFGNSIKFQIYSDFRLRYENDWDSEQTNGPPREDRERLRMRARLGVNVHPGSDFTIGARIRSSPGDSQQSPHITLVDFNNNASGGRKAVVDKWFVKYNTGPLKLWIGRHSLPAWKQNEIFWDDDVIPAGIGLRYEQSTETNSMSFNGGYFTLPDGDYNFNGRLALGQIVSVRKIDGINLSLAAGVFDFDADRGSKHLLNGNGNRDYTILLANVRTQFNLYDTPVSLGADIINNIKNYSSSNTDMFTASNKEQTEGYVLSLNLGKLNHRGDWLAAYYYARIETLAVNASYAQDDWMRWGSAGQTSASDFKGHEFRVGIAINKHINFIGRYYMTKAITSRQDGKRFRIDVNYTF